LEDQNIMLFYLPQLNKIII